MNQQWTNEELIRVLIVLSEKLCRQPTIRDIRDKTLKSSMRLPSVKTFIDHFGSWNKALAAADFTPRPRGDLREQLPKNVINYTGSRINLGDRVLPSSGTIMFRVTADAAFTAITGARLWVYVAHDGNIEPLPKPRRDTVLLVTLQAAMAISYSGRETNDIIFQSPDGRLCALSRMVPAKSSDQPPV